MRDLSSTTYPTGASLYDILFSFVLGKYIVCDVCGLLYITPTYTSSMQELILQGMQQKLQKSCSRCKKNTWHVESNYILQHPKYLLLIVNRFRHTNDITKDRCSIPMDATVMLGALKFNLRAAIDHHGQSRHSSQYTASINCCKQRSIASTTKLQSLKLLIATPLLHMCYFVNWLTYAFWTLIGGLEFDYSLGSPSY